MKWSKKSLKNPKNSPNSQDENQQRPTNFKRPSGNKLGLPSNTPGQSELERSATLAAMLKSRIYCYLCSAKVIIYFIILVNDYLSRAKVIIYINLLCSFFQKNHFNILLSSVRGILKNPIQCTTNTNLDNP